MAVGRAQLLPQLLFPWDWSPYKATPQPTLAPSTYQLCHLWSLRTLSFPLEPSEKPLKQRAKWELSCSYNLHTLYLKVGGGRQVGMAVGMGEGRVSGPAGVSM